MTEIELDILICQCLSRPIPNKTTLKKEVKAWHIDRNPNVVRVDLHFTTADARIKQNTYVP
jgi:hypothetical protein